MTEDSEQPRSYDEIKTAENSAAVAFKVAAGKIWDQQRKTGEVGIEEVAELRGLLEAWLKALSDREELRLAREAYAAKRGNEYGET